MNTTRKSAVVTPLICLAIGAAIGVAGMKLKAETTGTPETVKLKPTGLASNQSLVPPFQNPGLGSQGWDPAGEIQGVQTQLDKMEAQMDKSLGQMSAQFRNESQPGGFRGNSDYALSLNLEDLKNRYVVQAFLPDTKASNVNVKLENNQTLQVSMNNKESQATHEKDMASNVSEWGQYEQTIQLPSRVKADDMKIVRHEHELLITLPKA